MGVIRVQLMWNGVWSYEDGVYVYKPQPHTVFGNKTLVLNDDNGILTLYGLKCEVAKRMGLGIESAQNLQLCHMRPGLESYPAPLIDDDGEVSYLFTSYAPTETVRMYVVVEENGRETSCAPPRGHAEKMIPRRSCFVMRGTESGAYESFEQTVPAWEAGLNEDHVLVGSGGGADGDRPSGSGPQPMAICAFQHESDEISDGCPNENEHYDTDSGHGESSDEEENPGQDNPGQGNDAHVGDDGTNPQITSQPWGTQLEHHLTIAVPKGKTVDSKRTDGTGIYVGETFRSAKEMKDRLKVAATKYHWAWGRGKTDKTRCSMKCRDTTCNWYIAAYKLQHEEHYVVSKHRSNHTCSEVTTNFKHSNVKVEDVAEATLDEYRDGADRPTIKTIRALVKSSLNTQVSDDVCYASRARAWALIHGTRHEQYQQLPAFFHLLERQNPGSYTKIEVDENNRFKYCFMGIGAQLSGVKFMRPVLVIDAAHMKNEPLQIVVSTMVDSEDKCFPIAWGIIDKEDNEAWAWYLSQLSKFVKNDDHLVIVSDRHNAIKHAVAAVYTEANHVYCWWHIKQNLVAKFGADKWVGLFYLAAIANTRAECHRLLNTIHKEYPTVKSVGNVMMTIADYLTSEECPPHKWSRSFADKTRFFILTSNHAESINSMLREARFHCVLSFLTRVVAKMSEWWNKRRTKSGLMVNQLTTVREKLMTENMEKAILLYTDKENRDQYRVWGQKSGTCKVTFHLGNRTCDCRLFELDWQPCVHACACAAKLRKDDPLLGKVVGQPDSDGAVMYKFTSNFYSADNYRQAYANVIEIVPDRMDWNNLAIPYWVNSTVVLPPIKKVSVGAPQSTRFPSQGEVRRWPKKHRYRCSFCNEAGHNQKTCVVKASVPTD